MYVKMDEEGMTDDKLWAMLVREDGRGALLSAW